MTYRDHSVGVVVPAYDEAETVEDVVTDQPAFVDRVYAVDDGSTDGTGDAVDRVAGATADPSVEAVHHEHNRGAGAAVATGYRRALDGGHDLVVTVDADGQMDPGRMADLLDPLVEGEADYAKGDRLASTAHRDEMPRHRVVGNLLLTELTRLASGCAVSDPQNGYTAITAETLATLDLERLPDDHAYCNDLLVQLGDREADVADVAMPAIYGEESSTISYPRFVATTLLVLSLGSLRRLRPGTEPGADRSDESHGSESADDTASEAHSPSRQRP